MSRQQPPLPPGLPPKPRETYRLGADSYDGPDSPKMFQFGGNKRPAYDRRSPPRNSYAPGNDRYRDDYRNDYRDDNYRSRETDYAPGTRQGRRDTVYDRYDGQNNAYRSNDDRYRYQNHGRPPSPPRLRSAQDTYRPQKSNFTFRAEAPSSIDFRAADTQRPRSPLRQRDQGQPYNRNHNFAQRSGQGGQRGGYRGRGGPRLASERVFLTTNREPTPDLMTGMAEDDRLGARYISIEDVSDSSEAEMDMSDDEGQEEDGQPMKKQARTGMKAADGESVPKWSNPDPYTVLPPPDETQRKKKDVVKLIRKARIEAVSASKANARGETDDFISFDFRDELHGEDGTEEEILLPKASGAGVIIAPTGPRQVSQQITSPMGVLTVPTPDAPNTHSTVISSLEPAAAPGYPSLTDLTSEPAMGNTKRDRSRGAQKLASSSSAHNIDLTSEPALGSRKRTIRDEIKETPTLSDAVRHGPRVNNAPEIHKSMKGIPKKATGQVLAKWASQNGITPTPWIVIDHCDTANMGVWLHKEIVDFYDFVKPRGFEGFIRSKLVEDLRLRVQNAWPGADVQSFGSFPAGLYLPNADMDVVWLSPDFLNRGVKVFGQSNRDIRKIGQWLEQQNLPARGSLDVILSAKVPLVKYVDRLTGLKVDISFENTTGLTANKTFQDWKAAYPAMPILVTVIKHLLAMRGLNEPVNGGIGGFSVICLVVSLLQLMPQVQSRSMVPEHHLGEILMEFLDLYGNEFNVTTTAIQFDPPGYVSKMDIRNQVYKPTKILEKFCILDPNDPANDISGGSANTPAIRRCFSQAFHKLQGRMGSLNYSQQQQRQNQSILGCIFSGNYSHFVTQREHLAHLHEQLFGPIED